METINGEKLNRTNANETTIRNTNTPATNDTVAKTNLQSINDGTTQHDLMNDLIDNIMTDIAEGECMCQFKGKESGWVNHEFNFKLSCSHIIVC